MSLKEKIRELAKKESLRILKESQVSFLKEEYSLDKVIQDIDDSIIDVNEKKIEKLKKEEESAKNKEDFFELKRIKEDQVFSIDKLIKGYQKKVEILNKIKAGLEEELIQVQTNGAGVFKNQELIEFNNDNFQKDWGIRIETQNHFIDLVKILDNNAYKVINTNINGLLKNDLLKLPDLKIGGSGNVEVYRKVGERHENVSKFEINNIKKMIKNPK